MLDKLQVIRDKYIHLEEQLADPGTIGDMERWKKLNKEYKNLQPLVQAFEQYQKVNAELEGAREIESDPEMRDMAREEIDRLQPRLDELEAALKTLLTPRDPDHSVRFDPARSAEPPTSSGSDLPNTSSAFCEALRVAMVSAFAIASSIARCAVNSQVAGSTPRTRQASGGRLCRSSAPSSLNLGSGIAGARAADSSTSSTSQPSRCARSFTLKGLRTRL